MPEPDTTRIAELTRELEGTVLGPGDAAYDQARSVWNGRFDRWPRLIVRAAGAEDVVAAVRFARTQGLRLSVRGGGHDYAGNTIADGALLIDLGLLRGIDVDPPARRAVVGAGATWGELDHATQAHGLATTGGTVSTVGVAGVSLGGGVGWLTRKHGLTVDNVRSARIVTAQGDIVRASADENPDLLWAIRGGGGNFGVVTSFEYDLHEVGPELLAGQVLYPAQRAAELLRWYRDFFRDAPDEVMCFPFLLRIPPVEAFPEALHGTLALDFVVAYAGPVEEGRTRLAPFREHGDPILDAVGPQPYVTLQQSFDAGMPKGNRWYSRSLQFDELTDAAIDTLVEHLEPFPGPFTVVYLTPHGGAVGRVAPDAMAYPHRSSAHGLHIFPGWADPAEDEEVMAWADAFHQAMTPHGNERVYVNLLGDGEPERVREAYRSNHARLAELKRKWDPDNLFRGNHNIRPAS